MGRKVPIDRLSEEVEKILEDGEKYANQVSREKLNLVQKAVGLRK